MGRCRVAWAVDNRARKMEDYPIMPAKILETIDLTTKTAYIEGLGEIKVSPYVKIKGLFTTKTAAELKGALRGNRSFDRGVKIAKRRLNEWRASAVKR